MTPFRTHSRLRTRTALFAALLAAAPAAPAQVPDEVVEDAAVAAPAQGFGIIQQHFEIGPQQFDMWVFGNNVVVHRAGERTANNPSAKLENLLELRIDELSRACTMSEAQQDKLRLAGRGDVARFLGRVEVARRGFEEVRKDQQRWQPFYQKEIVPLRSAMNAGLFGDGSLFARTVPRALDPKQFAAFEEDRRARAAYHYGALVDLLAANLGRVLGFSAHQRAGFARVIKRETRPPKAYGMQEYNAVFYQASAVPLDQFKGVLDDAQREALGRHFQRMAMYRQNLIANGYAPDDRPRKELTP